MEHDVQIDLKNSSIDSVLATLRTQGITSLEDLVERTVGSVDDVLSSRADSESVRVLLYLLAHRPRLRLCRRHV